MQLASALMLWLNCLPEPLLASELSNILLQATNICEGAERLHVLQQVFSHVRPETPSPSEAYMQMLFPYLPHPATKSPSSAFVSSRDERSQA
jgi:hypothetical protein